MTAPEAPRPQSRSFLFLQGPLSPLYSRLGDELERHGHSICRIDLCVGDWLNWWRSGAISYRGSIADWPHFIARIVREHHITDVTLHGDQRPYHKAAAEVARRAGVRIIVTELGYLRPDWMTLELDGTSAGSHFPRDRKEIQQLAARLPEVDLIPRYKTSFWRVAVPDVIYNLSSTLLWFLYPRFRRHTIYFPPLEYAAWLGRLLMESRRNRLARAVIERVVAERRSLFLVPMQLEGDFQIRAHSPFKGQTEGLNHILSSFARAASPESVLLIKSHPLDNGLERWGLTIARIAVTHGVAERVHFLDGGSLTALFPHVSGLVTINSSAGLEAVLTGIPVKTLGPALYDIAGLTNQGTLDEFWRSPKAPDAAFAADFVRALAGTVQVRGTIYSREGLDVAVTEMTAHILTADFLQRGIKLSGG